MILLSLCIGSFYSVHECVKCVAQFYSSMPSVLCDVILLCAFSMNDDITAKWVRAHIKCSFFSLSLLHHFAWIIFSVECSFIDRKCGICWLNLSIVVSTTTTRKKRHFSISSAHFSSTNVTNENATYFSACPYQNQFLEWFE